MLIIAWCLVVRITRVVG